MPRYATSTMADTSHTRELIESAKRTGAPDPRVVSIMSRADLGIAWVETGDSYLSGFLHAQTQGNVPH